MLGKRPRQMQRTTSMSQLGRPYLYAQQTFGLLAPPSTGAANPDTNPPSAGCSQKTARPAGGSQDHPILSEIVEAGVGDAAVEIHMEYDIIVQNSQQDTESISTMLQSCGVDVHDQSCSMRGGPTQESSHLLPESGLWVPFVGSVPRYPLHPKSEDYECMRPVDFLDFCFFCNRRLVHERDIFIYKGDIAFCSEECRNHLIASDERLSISTSRKGRSERTGKVSETAVAA